jgi:hypothetical protein
VELETFFDPTGRIQPLVFAEPSLPPLSTAITHDPARGMPGYDEIWPLVAREPSAFFALNDLIAAITLPHHAAVNCGRALESIRRLVADESAANRNVQWLQFNERLNVSREYREMVMDISTTPRHGGRPDIPAQDAQEVIRRAWVIMDRYFHFLKRGKNPLPLSEFPLL